MANKTTPRKLKYNKIILELYNIPFDVQHVLAGVVQKDESSHLYGDS